MNMKTASILLFIPIIGCINAETPSPESYWNQKEKQANTAWSNAFSHTTKKKYHLYQTKIGERYKFHEDIALSCSGALGGGAQGQPICPEVCNLNDKYLQEALRHLKQDNQYAPFNLYEIYVDSVQKNEEALIFWKGIYHLSSHINKNEWNKSEAIEKINALKEEVEKDILSPDYYEFITKCVCAAAKDERATWEARKRGINRLYEEIEKYDQLYQQEKLAKKEN